MLKLFRTKMALSLHPSPPISPYLLINIPSQLEAWHKEVTRPSITPICTGYDKVISS